jgi:alkylation response protein AidB-like acyl-CoA dehydrogenase
VSSLHGPGPQPGADHQSSTGRRDALITAIKQKAEEFAEAGGRSEEIRRLPERTVGELRDLGLFWVKTPAELGGQPLAPLEFCDVIEELAYADGAVAWAAMIGAGCCGLASGWLPEAARMFPPGEPLPVVAGQPSPTGAGNPVDGGYMVTGRWGFSSGITHADWLIGAFPEAGKVIVFGVPKKQAEVIDHWHVAGLRGTGSLDWRVESVFVPNGMTYELGSAAPRGGGLFRLGMPAFISNEVPPWCLGVARRALDEMTGLSASTARAPGGPTVSERAVFHKELGRAYARIGAARLLHRDAMDACWRAACAGSPPSAEQQIAVTTASVFAVETCAEVVFGLFRYGGGRVLSLSSPVQRHLRDLIAARQHRAVSEESYETDGRFRVESLRHS